METAIWQECPAGSYILYTEDRKLIAQITGWKAYQDGRIRTMGERINGPIGIQFRFARSLYKRVAAACAKVAL